MDVFSQHAVHGFPEAVVPEPRVGHDKQGEASPAAFDGCEQPDGDDVLRPRISGLILFGRMVEHLGARKDFFSCLGVDVIIDGQQ